MSTVMLSLELKEFVLEKISAKSLNVTCYRFSLTIIITQQYREESH